MGEKEFDSPGSSLEEIALADHFSSLLDGQVGKSEARFRQFLADQQTTTTTPLRSRFPNRFAGWTFGMVGAAMAASLAALWAGPSFRQMVPQRPVNFTPAVETSVSPAPMLVRQDMQSQTFDDGTVMVDDQTPMRVLRRHDLQRTQWLDQDQNVQSEEVMPQDHVVLVHMKTY